MRSQRIDRLISTIRRLRLLSLFTQCVLIAASGWTAWNLVIAVAGKYLVYHPTASMAFVGTILLVLLTRSIAIYVSRSETKIAAELDMDYSLKERLSTYMELRDTGHPFVEALARETEKQVSAVSVVRSAHLTYGITAPLVVLVVLAGSLAFLPYLPELKAIAERKEERRQIHKEAKELLKSVEKFEKETTSNPELKQLLKGVRETASNLQKLDVDKTEALKQLNALQEKWKQAQTDLQRSQQKALEQKTREAGKGNPSSRPYTDAEKKQFEKLAKELQEALGTKDLTGGREIQDAIRKEQLSRQDFEGLKKALERYKAESAESKKCLADLQGSMDKAQKGISSGPHNVTYDSKLEDRKVETGKAGVNDGPGTTNRDVGPQHFNTTKKDKGEYVEDRTKADYEQLYKGERENAGSDPFFLNSEWNESGEPGFTRIRTFGLDSNSQVRPSQGGAVPQGEEESEIRKEKIPASYQKIVKKYFEQLE